MYEEKLNYEQSVCELKRAFLLHTVFVLCANSFHVGNTTPVLKKQIVCLVY